MKTKIAFPEPPSVPAKIPMFVTSAPAWNDERVTELGARFHVRGTVIDAGNWFVGRDRAGAVIRGRRVMAGSHSD